MGMAFISHKTNTYLQDIYITSCNACTNNLCMFIASDVAIPSEYSRENMDTTVYRMIMTKMYLQDTSQCMYNYLCMCTASDIAPYPM